MMRYLKFILLLLIPLNILAQPIETDLSNYFSDEEIKDLELITEFFQKEFCKTTDRNKFEDCIPKLGLFFPYDEFRSLINRISWRRQQKLYSKISDSTFNKVWSLCKAWILKPKKYEYREICFSMNKDFIAFAESLALSNPALEGYGAKLENVGFSKINEILHSIAINPNETDLNDQGIQILLAIHFLTENDRMNRDKKAIRLQEKYYRKLVRKN